MNQCLPLHGPTWTPGQPGYRCRVIPHNQTIMVDMSVANFVRCTRRGWRWRNTETGSEWTEPGQMPGFEPTQERALQRFMLELAVEIAEKMYEPGHAETHQRWFFVKMRAACALWNLIEAVQAMKEE